MINDDTTSSSSSAAAAAVATMLALTRGEFVNEAVDFKNSH